MLEIIDNMFNCVFFEIIFLSFCVVFVLFLILCGILKLKVYFKLNYFFVLLVGIFVGNEKIILYICVYVFLNFLVFVCVRFLGFCILNFSEIFEVLLLKFLLFVL